MEWFLLTALLFAWRSSYAHLIGDECNLPILTYEPNRTIVTASLTRNRYVQDKDFDWEKEYVDQKLRGDITELGVEMPLYRVREMLIHFSSVNKGDILAKIMLTNKNTSPLKSFQYLVNRDNLVTTEGTVPGVATPIHEQFHRLYFDGGEGRADVIHFISVGEAGKTITNQKICIRSGLGNVPLDRLLIQLNLKDAIVKKIVVKGYADPPPKKPG